MATVYLGRVNGSPQHSVALKVIRDEFSLNPEFVNMFLDEAKIVANLVHPNIVRLYELGADGQRLFLAMELLFGQSLWDVWDACRTRGVRLRYDTVAWIGARVAEALHHAHELRDESGRLLDVVHRDVNATNIFVTYDGQVKVIDFGLAKARNRVSKTAAGIIKGKTAYMSPEQAIGHTLDRRTDVFALATTLWELTADQRLFKQPDDIETLKRVYAADVPDPTLLVDGYPPDLWAILKMGLAREKEDRFASAGAFAAALSNYAQREGRVVAEAEIATVMAALFEDEKSRQAEWLAEASSADRPAPTRTMRSPLSAIGEADATAVTPPVFPPIQDPSDPRWNAATSHGLFAPPPSRRADSSGRPAPNASTSPRANSSISTPPPLPQPPVRISHSQSPLARSVSPSGTPTVRRAAASIPPKPASSTTRGAALIVGMLILLGIIAAIVVLARTLILRFL